MLRGIVRLEYARLRLVCLREGIATLLAHALHLPDLPDRLLELLHPTLARALVYGIGGGKGEKRLPETYLGR